MCYKGMKVIRKGLGHAEPDSANARSGRPLVPASSGQGDPAALGVPLLERTDYAGSRLAEKTGWASDA